MKKYFVLVLLVVFAFSLSSLGSVFAANEELLNRLNEIEETQALKMYEFNKMYQGMKSNEVINGNFGGMYFEESTLIINIVKNNEKEFQQKLGLTVEYEISSVDYSIQELENLKIEFEKDISNLKLSSQYIDVKNNKLHVETKLTKSEFISKIGKAIDLNMLEIESSTTQPIYKVKYTVNGYNYSLDGAGCTVGFAARNNSGDPGFVSAGHCAEGTYVGKNVYYDGDHAGDVDDWHFEDGDVDAVFVELRDPWIGTTWLPTRSLVFGGSYDYIGTFSSYYTVGQLVRFYGRYNDDGLTNTSVEYGYVTVSDQNIYDGITKIYDNMFATDHVTHFGDSGGPAVVRIYVGEGFYENNVIGVLSFEHPNTHDNYFSKAYEILDHLNLTAY